jgi:hypothetical protein
VQANYIMFDVKQNFLSEIYVRLKGF